MLAYLDILDFLAVLLRAATFSAISLCAGGILFLVFVAYDAFGAVSSSVRRWTRRFALVLAVLELVQVVLNSVVLSATSGASLASLPGANYFQAGALAIAASVLISVLMRRAVPRTWALLLGLTLLLAATTMTSHASARLNGSAWLSAMTVLHLANVALWIGELPFLLLATRIAAEEVGIRLVRRFSQIALIGVALVTGSGLVLSLAYVESWSALYGTAYGYMILTKVTLFGLALILGAANNRLAKTLPQRTIGVLHRLRSLGEAEIGIGFAAILVAASLTSQPPAVDLRNGRLTMSEIVTRFHPELPRLESPPVAELSPPSPLPDLRVPAAKIDGAAFLGTRLPGINTPADIAWSEYNHHWAGIIVAATGLLALLSRLSPLSLARYWPLMFIGLAVFIVLRADPENWPLGPRSFWQSFLVPDVAQHRLYAALIVVFAVFELSVQTGRIRSRYPALVFPLICAVGGALLLTHNHPLGNIKEELLAEMSHTPIAIAGITAGSARWLELRLPRAPAMLGWIWPASLILIGVILVLYRES